MQQGDVAQASTTKIQQIVNSILASIAAGELQEGDRVTSERKLALDFDVSVGTVQRALQKLEHRGVLIREHGRGSFVRGMGAALNAHYVRFCDARGNDLPLYWHVLGHKKIKPKRDIVDFFGTDEALVRIDRRVDVNGQFVLHAQFYLSEHAYASLPSEVTDSTNLRESLSQALSVPVLRVEQLVGFDAMPADVAASLGCDQSSPCFMLELRSYAVDNRPVSLQRIYGEPFRNARFVMDTRRIG
ncbi:GntR family transcriptional regulator [Variovorax sp. UC122_21]|uniref:GntR family transcriptional regulator n=1 Tax=Variovorax TaxID=34072 RepID=UPI0019324124|nr:GntR family transcriptional regulator [Variovorax paradoxus]